MEEKKLFKKSKNKRIYKIKHKRKKELKKLYKKRLLKKIIFSIFFMIIIFIFFILMNRYSYNRILNLNNKNFLKEELIYVQKKINNFSKDESLNIYETNNETINHPLITLKEKKKKIRKELKIMKNFIYQIVNGNITSFNKCDNPKISIVISIYNGEGYLKNALLSIQNQDFKEIEIIIVDDCSKDNSVNLIKELMEIDHRILLFQNKENRGALYTKSKGILYSKGKYVMTLDEDDMYTQSDVFSTIYEEAEKDDLDILGFASLETGLKFSKRLKIHRYLKTPVLYPPDITKRMYSYKRNGKVKRVGDVLWNYIFRTELFQKTIEKIYKNVFNIKMNWYDDFLLFFSITRNARKLKQIPRIFYLKIKWKKNNNTKIIFRLNEKKKNIDNLNCMALANYIRYLLMNTNNTIEDKKIASFELNNYFNSKKCYNNNFSKKEIENICQLFLKNVYIEDEMKDKIYNYLGLTNVKMNYTHC